MHSIASTIVFLVELVLSGLLVSWLHFTSRGEPPPLKFLFQLFVAGAAAATIVAVVELRYVTPHGPVSLSYLVAYNLAISLTEELGKYFVAVFLILHSRYLHKLSDGIYYLIIIGLGFSLVEDALFLSDPQTVAGYRLLSFYMHSGTSAIIGYYLGRFHFNRSGYTHLLLGIVAAVALHLAYNLSTYVRTAPLAGILTFCLSVFISVQIFILFRRAVIEEFEIQHRKRVKSHTKLLDTTLSTGQN